jgi:hypothetical protein
MFAHVNEKIYQIEPWHIGVIKTQYMWLLDEHCNCRSLVF